MCVRDSTHASGRIFVHGEAALERIAWASGISGKEIGDDVSRSQRHGWCLDAESGNIG